MRTQRDQSEASAGFTNFFCRSLKGFFFYVHARIRNLQLWHHYKLIIFSAGIQSYKRYSDLAPRKKEEDDEVDTLVSSSWPPDMMNWS